MCDQNITLRELIHLACVKAHMVWSPSHGVLKYAVPECDLIILKRRLRIPAGVLITKFGEHMQHGVNYTEWEVHHAACVVILSQLDSFGVTHESNVSHYYVPWDQMPNHKLLDPHVEWVGDIQVMQDALTYLNMVT